MVTGDQIVECHRCGVSYYQVTGHKCSDPLPLPLLGSNIMIQLDRWIKKEGNGSLRDGLVVALARIDRLQGELDDMRETAASG